MGFDKESIEKMINEMAQKIVAEMQAADSVKQGGKILASNILPQLKLVNNFIGRTVVSGIVKKQFNTAAADLRAGKMDAKLAEYSQKLQSYSRDDVHAFITEKLSVATDPASAKANADKAGKALNDMTLTEFSDLTRATYFVLPPMLKSVYDTTVLQGRSIDQYAHELYHMTADQRAAKQLEMAQKLPVDDLADYVYGVLQKANPAELKTVVLTVLSKLNADDASGLALEGMNFAEDSLKMIKDKNILGVKDQKAAAKFGDRLKKVFSAVETGLITAGLHDQKTVEAILKKNFGNDNNQKGPKFG